jgi:hypothetical protein
VVLVLSDVLVLLVVVCNTGGAASLQLEKRITQATVYHCSTTPSKCLTIVPV